MSEVDIDQDARVLRELESRLARLYSDMAESTAKPTADQQSRMPFYKNELDALRKRAAQ